jgi:hypothetical protein
MYRRFKKVGNEEEMKKVSQLVNDKNLTREDLLLILKSLEVNQNISNFSR